MSVWSGWISVIAVTFISVPLYHLSVGAMAKEIRIEIVSRDGFWRNAFNVEWQYQHPQQALIEEVPGYFIVPESWLPDLQSVANQCFTKIRLAPSDPGRRQMLRAIFPR